MKTNKYILVSILLVVLLMLDVQGLWAQCPMCRMSAESNLANGGTEGLGLNRGILYMFSLPYLLVLTLGILYWRNNGRQTEEVE